jgi:hypothetical protein
MMKHEKHFIERDGGWVCRISTHSSKRVAAHLFLLLELAKEFPAECVNSASEVRIKEQTYFDMIANANLLALEFFTKQQPNETWERATAQQ